MAERSFTVHAQWDADARRWWTDGTDVPGLTCEAETFEALAEAVFGLAPDLLVANGVVAADGSNVRINLVGERSRTARLVA